MPDGSVRMFIIMEIIEMLVSNMGLASTESDFLM